MDAFETEGDHLRYPEWQGPLRAMMAELDTDKLKARVQAVETAIFNRQQALARSPDHAAERQAIQDALALLRAFKRSELSFPDWENK